MKSLIIKHFGEEEILAQITHSEDGQLVVVSDDDEARDHFSKLIDEIITNNPELPLTAGNEQVSDDDKTVTEETIMRNVSPTEEAYLDALWDHLNNSEYEFKGTRIKAYTDDISE